MGYQTEGDITYSNPSPKPKYKNKPKRAKTTNKVNVRALKANTAGVKRK